MKKLQLPTRWYIIKFRIKYAGVPKEIPLWEVDLIIAHQAIAPLLKIYEDDIILWRFHRMADPIKKLHQFSFHLFTRPDVVKSLYDEALQEDPTLKILVKHDYVSHISKEGGGLFRPEDTCDKEWSPHVKKAWPYYMMGVSKMWLELINSLALATGKPEGISRVKPLLDWYRAIEDEMLKIWRGGAHPLLHHLNAIFGYAPIDLAYVRRMRF